MKQYFTGFFTAVCLTASVFIFMGSQNKNLGDITCTSLKVVDENNFSIASLNSFILGGQFTLWNKKGQPMVSLSITDNHGGLIETYNADGKVTTSLITDVDGGGSLTTFNEDGKKICGIGTMTTGSGGLSLFNEKGDKIGYFGNGLSGEGGMIETFNKHGKSVGYVGVNKNLDGIAILSDRYGDAGWSATGKNNK